jgi:hypothetical protein
VAGVAALVASKYPTYSPLQVRVRIMNHGRDLPDHNFRDRGIKGLDADAALNGT